MRKLLNRSFGIILSIIGVMVLSLGGAVILTFLNFRNFYGNDFKAARMTLTAYQEVESMEKNILKGIILDNNEVSLQYIEESEMLYDNISKNLPVLKNFFSKDEKKYLQFEQMFLSSKEFQVKICELVKSEEYDQAFQVYNNQYKLLLEEEKKSLEKMSAVAQEWEEQSYQPEFPKNYIKDGDWISSAS